MLAIYLGIQLLANMYLAFSWSTKNFLNTSIKVGLYILLIFNILFLLKITNVIVVNL